MKTTIISALLLTSTTATAVEFDLWEDAGQEPPVVVEEEGVSIWNDKTMIPVASVLAESTTAKMTSSPYGNIKITFSDFKAAAGFESYKCIVTFNNNAYSDLVKSAYKITKNGEVMYECLYQGELTSGRYYNVYFQFEDRPYGYITNSPSFTLKVE